mgnify:CR=1 FL=1|jgi:uncharacterized protein with beta-barrel porin domain|tara:strand:- start:84 stop:758 length:675 start_codon:yes stop_codon:yes gene_type:complete
MKKSSFILVLFFNFLAFSQPPVSKTIGEFSKLKVYDLINVELIQSSENKIEISGENAKNVSIIQKNNTLKIRMEVSKYFKGEDTFVKLFYTKINTIDVNEGAKVVSETPIQQYEVELKAQEGGEITVPVKTKVLTVKSVSGGKIQVHGTSKSQNININTGGVYKGEKLQAQFSKIKIKAGGSAEVRSSDLINVKIFAGGFLTIFGQTTNTKQNNIFGGKIIYKD